MSLRLTILILNLLLVLTSQASAYVDPEDILKNLPPPQVNYPLPVILATMPVLLPQNVINLPEIQKDEPEADLESEIQQISNSQIIKSFKKLFNNIVSSKPKNTGTELTTAKKLPENKNVSTGTVRLAKKPPQIDIRPISAASNQETDKVKKNASDSATVTETAGNPGQPVATVSEIIEPASSPVAAAVNNNEKPPGTENSDNSDEGAPEASSEEDTDESNEKITGSFDSVIAKATGLYKKGDWKGIKALFNETPEAIETKDGRKFVLEAEINEIKPNYMQIKRYSDQIVKAEKNDPLGNYGLALYWLNNRKPDNVKALKYLDIALKSKNPPSGASNLYWQVTLKKYIPVLLVLLALIVGGISKVIKKRKSATIDLETSPETSSEEINNENTNNSVPGGFMQKLKFHLSNLKNRFSKKKDSAGSDSETTLSDKEINETITNSEDEKNDSPATREVLADQAVEEDFENENTMKSDISEDPETPEEDSQATDEESEEEIEIIEEIIEVEEGEEFEEGVEYEIIEEEVEEELEEEPQDK